MVNAVLVVVKITALTLFVVLALPVMNMDNFEPFAPLGFAGHFGGGGLDLLRLCRLRRGFDRGGRNQEPAAQHADRPDRQPRDLHRLLHAGRGGRDRLGRCAAAARRGGQGDCARHATGWPRPARQWRGEAVVCSKEALAWTLREIGWQQIGNLVGLAAGLALPSVILMMMFGQTRIFFVMSRDGLLPEGAEPVHPNITRRTW
jgi:APA family basic amino acid/polyamine antiporter